MKKIWAVVGRVLYVLARPGLYFYLNNTVRTRVVVYKGREVLLLKDWLGDGSWKLPGGGVHKGEDIVVSALRELREETGISAQPSELKSHGLLETKGHGAKVTLHIFSLAWPKEMTIKRTSAEIIEIAWQSIADSIKARETSDNTKTILNKLTDLF